MKRFLLYIFIFITFILISVSPTMADSLPIKVMGLNYDTSSSLVIISTQVSNTNETVETPEKLVRLTNPNRLYFDINNAVLVGDKKQIVFEKSHIKEIRLAQFDTNPNIVRAVITFEEDFNTSDVQLINSGGTIIVKTEKPKLINNYFNIIYDETSAKQDYSHITANSQFIQKVAIPLNELNDDKDNTIKDIQKAFEDTTLTNTDGKTYDSVISVDLSTKLKLRTKYFINQYIPKNNGLLVSGIGQITTSRVFHLTSPKRAVIDLPNTYLDKIIRNREISLCSSENCHDTAKIGQFDFNTARIVITSDSADKYIPIYSKDSQSLFLINSEKLNHIALENNIANLNKAYVKNIDSKNGELILSFTAPVVHSIVRTDNTLNLFFFNVKSYNEQDLTNTLANSQFKQLTMSLLPQVGIKTSLKISKKDIIKIEEGVDGKAIKVIISRNSEEDTKTIEKPIKKTKNSNKVVIDPGHGGTDYGAIREGINEKDITLDISKRVQSILLSKGIKAVLTRDDDTFVSLEDRVDFSESEEPEIFISVHVNSAVSTDPNGIETHWYHDYSKPLAEIIHKHFVKEIPTAKDRGLFKSKFYVINHTTSPAVLCEIGFLSNPEERNEIITDKRKQQTAKAIAEGIIDYLKGSK